MDIEKRGIQISVIGVVLLVVTCGIFALMSERVPEMPPPTALPVIEEQREPQPELALEGYLAQHTALLERIAGVLERWEAEQQAAKTAAAERSRHVMEHYNTGAPTQGLPALPNTWEKP